MKILALVFLGLVVLAAGITLNALGENYRLVRRWRKDHGR